MEDIQRYLSDNMKLLRKEQCLSQAKLAKEIDTAANYISQIEQGNKYPSPVMLEKIAGALGVKSYNLFLPLKTVCCEELEKKACDDIKKILKRFRVELCSVSSDD